MTATALVRVFAAATAAVALAACGGLPGSGPASTAPQPGAVNQALLNAGETAQAAVVGATVIAIETERDKTGWKVQVVSGDGTEHQVGVSADGTSVVSGPSVESETAQDKARHRSRVKAAKLDYRQAVSAVTVAVPGRVTELNLGSHIGITVWEADVTDSDNTEHTVRIDAASGGVVTKN